MFTILSQRLSREGNIYFSGVSFVLRTVVIQMWPFKKEEEPKMCSCNEEINALAGDIMKLGIGSYSKMKGAARERFNEVRVKIPKVESCLGFSLDMDELLEKYEQNISVDFDDWDNYDATGYARSMLTKLMNGLCRQ